MIPNLPSDVFRFFGWFYSVPVLPILGRMTCHHQSRLVSSEPCQVVPRSWIDSSAGELHWGTGVAGDFPLLLQFRNLWSRKSIAAHRPSTFGLWGAFMSRPQQNFDRLGAHRRLSDWGRAFGYARGNPNAGRLQDVARDEVALGILGHPGAF